MFSTTLRIHLCRSSNASVSDSDRPFFEIMTFLDLKVKSKIILEISSEKVNNCSNLVVKRNSVNLTLLIDDSARHGLNSHGIGRDS